MKMDRLRHKSQFTSSILIQSSLVSPGFEELEWFDLDLLFFLYRSDWSWSKTAVCGEGLRAESTKWYKKIKNTHYKN